MESKFGLYMIPFLVKIDIRPSAPFLTGLLITGFQFLLLGLQLEPVPCAD